MLGSQLFSLSLLVAVPERHSSPGKLNSYAVGSRRKLRGPYTGQVAPGAAAGGAVSRGPAFLFDLDGTLVDSVYQHVIAWREALEQAGIELSVWRIHRRIGMSGGLFVNALLRETGHSLAPEEARKVQERHAEAYTR